jgi:ribosomal-protein-alanine N-acetyltransferase
VLPARRRRGIGRQLMAALLDWAAARGIARIHLEVAEDNDAACALYRGCGFAAIGRRRGYYGRGRDALLMARVL